MRIRLMLVLLLLSGFLAMSTTTPTTGTSNPPISVGRSQATSSMLLLN